MFPLVFDRGTKGFSDRQQLLVRSSYPMSVVFMQPGVTAKLTRTAVGLKSIQGAPIKNNPLGKIHYLSYCKRFFTKFTAFIEED